MRVLVLSPYPAAVVTTLGRTGDLSVVWNQRVDAEYCGREGIEFIISYGYRRLIGADVLARYPERAINLHISYLPWNRGADPNLWSWIDGTPKGVTIHFLDAGIDTGPVLVQEPTSFDEGETLASSYFRLRDHIERMFAESWPRIRLGQIPDHPQPPGGSLHRKGDATKILDRLPLGYDTPVADLLGLAETAE